MEKQIDKETCIFREQHKDMFSNYCPECGTMLHNGLKIYNEARKGMIKIEDVEKMKLDILKECQRQMLLRRFDVKEIYSISRIVRDKFKIKFVSDEELKQSLQELGK